ncbi:24372_t:CDS:2, partial [Dentiscutata erythropus]
SLKTSNPNVQYNFRIGSQSIVDAPDEKNKIGYNKAINYQKTVEENEPEVANYGDSKMIVEEDKDNKTTSEVKELTQLKPTEAEDMMNSSGRKGIKIESNENEEISCYQASANISDTKER